LPKLFVAIGFPVAITAELARIQPQRMQGLRLAEAGQLHLTLHFMGEMDPQLTEAALRGVAVPQFRLALHGVGRFASAGGDTTLWAGVRESSELQELREAVAAVLEGVVVGPKEPKYSPHITLARCTKEVPARVIEEFLSEHRQFSVPDLAVTSFGLYSSAFVEGAPVYRAETIFSLLSAVA
jgi:RNA 2',3'-cyclic 3'-phosphodiesterase